MSAQSLAPAQAVRRGPWTSFILGALACTMAVALHQWPARWLAPLVHQLSDGRVELVEAQGTLWEGSAHLALGSGSERVAVTAWSQRLHWQLSPQGLGGWLLRLRPEQEPENNAWIWQFRWYPSGWQLGLSDIDWRMPTAWLVGLGAPWNTVQPDGVLRLRSQGWQWRQGRADPSASGELTLTLERLATRLSSLQPLGDYQLRLHATTALQVELRTIQGHLRLSGQGQWHSGRLQFQGEAWADQAQDETALSNLLHVLGPRVGSKTLLIVG
jgi:general secretion pathway protein N